MSISSSHKKIFLLGFIIVILIAIPLSVYVAQTRQQTKSKASASTTLSFDPASKTTSVGEILTLDIVLDPGSGTTANQVSFVKLSISFDPTKFTTVSDSLAPNITLSGPPQNTLTFVLEDPVYTSGNASISLSIGADPTKVVTTKTKIAVLKLKALSTTEVNNPTSITFDSPPKTQVLSIASLDETSENVLSTSIPATVTIISAAVSTLLTPTPTSGPAPIVGGPAILTPTPTSKPTEVLIPTPTSVPAPIVGGPAILTPTPTSTLAAALTPTPTVQPLPTPTPIVILAQEPLPPTGPGETILGIGILGAIFAIIGGALFILL